MHEILGNLRTGSIVLDLGCRAGSFPPDSTSARVVRVDRELPSTREAGAGFVQADAAQLPFASQTFAAVILNHSLEHFDDLAGALQEIGRIIAPSGSLFVAVPDASTLTDRLYRWLAKGGGHVNSFTSLNETKALIERATGLRHVATRVLYSSLSFLNRCNSPLPVPWRSVPLGAGYEWSLLLYAWLSRRLDRYLNMRTGVYGWAFYFGRIATPIDTCAWVNVCLRCGGGCSAVVLRRRSLVRLKLLGLRVWECPACGASNSFADDPSD